MELSVTGRITVLSGRRGGLARPSMVDRSKVRKPKGVSGSTVAAMAIGRRRRSLIVGIRACLIVVKGTDVKEEGSPYLVCKIQYIQ